MSLLFSLWSPMVILLATVSCAAEGLTPSKALTPVNTVSFRAYDYGFDGPTTIGAGLTTIRMTNNGHDLHHIQLVRLPAGRSEQDFMEALKSNPTLPAWVTFAGGPNAVIPGEQASATIHLEEGQYLLICWIPDKKGEAHVSLGMSRPLLVTAAVNPLAASPQSDLSVRLVDFGFSLSQPLKAGSRTLEVANQGSERHELVVVQLAPGASVKDFAAAFEPGASGPPPGKPIGGLTGIEPGHAGSVAVDLQPGQYGLICFMPDSKTGAPHFTRGMMLDVTLP